MITLPHHHARLGSRVVPIAWQDTAWSVRIIVRSAAPVFRRLSNLTPIRRSARHASRAGLREFRSVDVSSRRVFMRPAVRPLRGQVSKYRRLDCDPAGMSRLAAFSALPLCCKASPRMRIFKYFQTPQFAL